MTTPADMYLPASFGKYFTMGSFVRSRGSSWNPKAGSWTSSVSQGDAMASMMCMTSPSLSIPMAFAIFSLVE